MEEARSVLGAHSCGIMTRNPETGYLVSIASLDLPPSKVSRIRIREGGGIAGLAVSTRRPAQGEDLRCDPRVRYPDLPRRSSTKTPSGSASRTTSTNRFWASSSRVRSATRCSCSAVTVNEG